MQLQAPQVGALIRRPVLVYAARMLLAHVLGAVFVFFLVLYVLPLPQGVPADEVHRVNTTAFVGFMPVSLLILIGGGLVAAWPILQWIRRGGRPTRTQRIATLRQPLRQLGVQLASWLTGLAVFILVNLRFGAVMVTQVVLAIVMGAAVACGVAYVMGERELRGMVARAWASNPEGEWRTASITFRVLAIWFLSTAIPVFGIVLIAYPEAVRVGPRAFGSIGPAVFMVAVLTLGVGLAGMVFVVRTIADPVRQVSQAMRRVEQGDVSTRVTVYDGSEIGRMQAGFNAMVDGLEERERMRDLLGKHIGEDVAREAVEHGTALGGRTLEVAVLFTDIIGSTGLAENNPPARVVEMLNEFFRVVVATVDAHGGFINKFEGDAALAIFGAPQHLDDPAGAALRAARALRDEIVKLGLADAGIGVSHGPVVAGYIGAPDRYEYTVIGDPVNEAARLTDLAKTRDGRVLAAARVLDAAHPVEADQWKRLDNITLRGRRAGTRLAAPRRSVLHRGFAVSDGVFRPTD